MNRRIYYDADSGIILAVTDGRQPILQEIALYRIPGYPEGQTLVLEVELTAQKLRNLKNYRVDLETKELVWSGEEPEPVEPGGGGDPETRRRVDELETEISENKIEFDQHTGNVNIHRKITIGTAAPAGGEDGDIYFRYE